MESSLPMEQRWGFMAPWFSRLRDKIALEYPKREEELWSIHQRRLEVRLPRFQDSFHDQDALEGFPYLQQAVEESFQLEFRKTREALALIAAVAHVDYDAWKCLLTKYCRVHIGREGEQEFEEIIPIRFVVFMDLKGRISNQCGDTLTYDLVQLCGPHQRKQLSSEYLETLSRIATLNPSLQAQKPGLDIGIPVRVYVSETEDARTLPALLEDIHVAEGDIVQQWKKYYQSPSNQTVASGTLRCTFILEPMMIDFSALVLSTETMAKLEHLVHNNVWFSQVSLVISSERNSHVARWKEAVGRFLLRTFDNTQRCQKLANTSYYHEPVDQNSMPKQLGSIHLRFDPSIRTSDLEAICSTIAVCQTAREISVNMSHMMNDLASRRKRWQCLAYAFFSKRALANSSVQSLALTSVCSMTTPEMNAVFDMLNSENSEQKLLEYPLGHVDERNAALKAQAPIACCSENQFQRNITSEMPISCARTFNDDGKSEWVNALVPGFGRCQVRRTDLVFAARSPTNKRLMSLSISFHKYQPLVLTGLPRFLAAIGQTLQFLSIDGANVELKFVLSVCPKLDALVLRSAFVDVRLDFTEFHSCNKPLPELSINLNDVASICSNASDPNHVLSKCLRRLRAFLTNRTLDPNAFPGIQYHRRVENDLTALRRLLEVNQSLEYLDIIVPFGYLGYMKDFRHHHLKPMNRSVKIWTDSKAAFLSVLTGASGCELNQHVVANIFEFAAPPILLKVFFREQRESSWGVRMEAPI